MAKKKETTIKLNPSSDAVTPGDVNIFYGHTLLAGLSENAAARLETENTICTKDIGIEYSKPAGESAFPTFSIDITNAHGLFDSTTLVGFTTLIQIETFDGTKWTGNGNPRTSTHYIPTYDDRDGTFCIEGQLISETNLYDVTINGIPVEYRGYGYNFYKTVTGYNTNVSIVIADKTT